jgi:Flp pilus assembly protein TadD
MGLRVGTGKTDIQSGGARLFRRRIAAALLIAACLFSSQRQLLAQHTTVRRHKVEEQDPVAAKLAAAEAAIDKQDYPSAEPLLKEVVAARPNDYTAWYDLGFLYHALGRNDDSVDAYKKSVQAKPNVFESNLNLGLALAQAGNPEAEQYLRAATKLTPSSHPAQGRKAAWLAVGHLLQSSNPEEAVNAFRQAAVLDPKDAETHLLAGAALEKAKSPEAEQEYQLALSIDPKSSDAMAALTNLYMSQHRFPDAENLLRKLEIVHPNDASVHFQLGRMLAIAGKNEDAVPEFEAGLKLDPADERALGDLADIYVRLRKFEDARQIYDKLLATSPNDASLHHLLGRALLQERKFPDSERELLKAVQLKPDLGEAYGDLAIAANENKDYPLAIKATDARAKFLPENPMTYFLRATAYDHLHDTKNASKYYHDFLNSAAGKYPDQEWQARHRLIAIEPKK